MVYRQGVINNEKKSLLTISLALLLSLNCNNYNAEKEWVENLIYDTPTVYDSLLIHDSDFYDSMSTINLTKEEFVEYFKPYRQNFEIFSVNEVYYQDSLLLEIRVDANNDIQRCSFYFKKAENWNFSHIMFEDYDIVD